MDHVDEALSQLLVDLPGNLTREFKLNNARPEFDEVDRKVMVNAAVNPDAVRPTIRRSASAPALRWVLEECLRQRRVGVCLIDEAQHLKRLASGRRLLDQMDTLKSLAATTGTMHVLIGTYELLGLTNLSAQLSRRSVEVHFGRYRASVDKDRLAFKSVLLTFKRQLPVSEEPDLVGLWERLYEGSAEPGTGDYRR